MKQRALIIGVTGGFGGAVARALAVRGWRIRALHRRPAEAAGSMGAVVDEWSEGDAMDPAAVAAAARGADLIVHATNPPRYKNWPGLALPMLENSIAAAQASGARLLFPGNLYNYGPDAWPCIREDSPQHPVSRKGRVRVRMESMLRQAPGVRALVLRAGDFFGGGTGSWFDSVIARPGKPLRAITYPGDPDVGHAWAYLPDMAETAARLVARESELGVFECFNFGGHYLARGGELAEAIRRVAGRPRLPVRRLPWAALYLAAPFNETARELIEMRYLWRRDLRLNDTRLRGFLGELPATPLDEAIRAALAP